jgi:hypothetical protein
MAVVSRLEPASRKVLVRCGEVTLCGWELLAEGKLGNSLTPSGVDVGQRGLKECLDRPATFGPIEELRQS